MLPLCHAAFPLLVYLCPIHVQRWQMHSDMRRTRSAETFPQVVAFCKSSCTLCRRFCATKSRRQQKHASQACSDQKNGLACCEAVHAYCAFSAMKHKRIWHASCALSAMKHKRIWVAAPVALHNCLDHNGCNTRQCQDIA